ncbi:MAG: FAD-binding protein [Candidatus Omnitrophica bacterium]|nr:FAD-binding protein [Candidatus Omnitrophota bacterium]
MDFIQKLRNQLGGKVSTDGADLEAHSADFGRMARKKPRVVVRPESTEDVAVAVQVARETRTSLAVRGQAHSQSGQSLSDGGILIDMTTLNKILEISKDRTWVRVQAGVVWSDLVGEVLQQGAVPPVLTNNLGVTVGGTLSVAGLGISSFRYGAQGDNVLSLKVVTGAGQMLDCSAGENLELFNAARSGLGQFAVITEAKLKLKPCFSRVRTYYLLYDDLETFMADSKLLMEEDRFDYLEAWCSPCPQGFRGQGEERQAFAEWFYPLHVSVELDPDVTLDENALLRGLSFYRKAHVEDWPMAGFVRRLESLFELWKRMGYWDRPHPWMETLLPWDAAPAYISMVLSQLPPHFLGGGHILLWPSRGNTSQLPLFMRPESEYVIGFGLLPGVPRDVLDMALAKLRLASDLSMQFGGKRYLSGIVDFDEEHWEKHFGNLWPALKSLKEKYDPDRILGGFLPL